MPKVLAAAIARMVAESGTEGQMLEAARTVFHEANIYGFTRPVGELSAEVCRLLRELMQAEPDAARRESLRRVIDDVCEKYPPSAE